MPFLIGLGTVLSGITGAIIYALLWFAKKYGFMVLLAGAFILSFLTALHVLGDGVDAVMSAAFSGSGAGQWWSIGGAIFPTNFASIITFIATIEVHLFVFASFYRIIKIKSAIVGGG